MQAQRAATTKRADWKRAWRALRGLVADPERTDLVFEIVDALDGPAFEREFARFRRHPDGQRLLRERPDLLATLSDREALRRLPEGSFGRAYAAFMDAEHLMADGLVVAENAAVRSAASEPVDPDRRFFGDRLRDMHDLWHVLTGYGRDEAGEAANLAFTVAQVPSRGVWLIVLAAAVLGPWSLTLAWPRYLLRAWRRGRHAAKLSLARYEELLPLPLDDVRRRLRIALPLEAHPTGIIVANRGDISLATA
jgi:ubiquinone biosynthesis protein COQ4